MADTNKQAEDMFKAMVLLRRRKGTTSEDFRAWWLERHAPMARQLPKLRRLCFNLVEAENDTPFDGVAELWFDSKADFESAGIKPSYHLKVEKNLCHWKQLSFANHGICCSAQYS